MVKFNDRFYGIYCRLCGSTSQCIGLYSAYESPNNWILNRLYLRTIIHDVNLSFIFLADKKR
ncbi:hypothetical protein [Bacillus sp. B1-WWTP-T-0.5-Post-4]|uniref:hypothetical protein n=1 Tax=Bacillus sp. B1-WWTP-T-0.5-Post-4 TaxID=2653219 RepID=UPI001D012D80|nr:hypothetical protein [Bacillus sp. B1-WWTP-T-0.5-Post-4]